MESIQKYLGFMCCQMNDYKLAEILGIRLARHIINKFRLHDENRSWDEFAVWFWNNCDNECKRKVCAAAGIEV